MARTAIVDLDEVVPDGPRVKLGGVVYELPPDLPVELYLWLLKANDGDPEVINMPEREQTERLYGEVLELFRYKQPDLERLPIRLSQLVTLIARVYGPGSSDDDQVDAPPPRRRPSGATTSSKTRARTRSRR